MTLLQMLRLAIDLDPRPRWAARASGVIVPEDLLHYEPPEPEGVWSIEIQWSPPSYLGWIFGRRP